MDYAIQVEVGKGQDNVMAQIHLEVVGEWFIRTFKKSSEGFIH